MNMSIYSMSTQRCIGEGKNCHRSARVLRTRVLSVNWGPLTAFASTVSKSSSPDLLRPSALIVFFFLALSVSRIIYIYIYVCSQLPCLFIFLPHRTFYERRIARGSLPCAVHDRLWTAWLSAASLGLACVCANSQWLRAYRVIENFSDFSNYRRPYDRTWAIIH